LTGTGCPGSSEIKLSLEVTQNAEQVERAVNAFIDHKLSKIRALRQNHQTRLQVQDSMFKKSDSTFLWVALVAKELEKAPIFRMRKLVEEMPATLEAFYNRMLEQAKQSDTDWEYVQLVLAAATLAYRPLHLAELAVVSGLPEDMFGGHANTSAVEAVVDFCGSFLTVKNDVAYLIHQSAKDYLSGRAANMLFPSGRDQAHRGMFTRSVEAMSAGLRRNIYGLPFPGAPIKDVGVPKPDPLVNLRYSCVHWASHLYDARSTTSSLDDQDWGRVGCFIRDSFLYWFESVALLRSLSDSIASLRRLENVLEVRFVLKRRGPYYLTAG
jgi:hypothetical protein